MVNTFFSVSRRWLETDRFFLFLEAACLFSSVLFCFVSRTGPEPDCFFLFLEAPSLFLPSRGASAASALEHDATRLHCIFMHLHSDVKQL